MKNYLQNGHIVRVTTPAGGIASGDALIVGSIFGIAAYSSAEGDPVELSTTGVFQLPKASAAVLAVGVTIRMLLAGRGVVGGSFQSVAPGEDTRFLLASLVVVIVGGMGSIPGAALGALLIGLAEQFGSVYFPTYAVVLTFIIMVVVLAFRPQGLMGRA